jgi:hypothetical protein
MGSHASNQETFLIPLGELPEKVKADLTRETNHYLVPIIINDTPWGSGTLVEAYGHYGILTAKHVVRSRRRPDLDLTQTALNGPKLFVPPALFPGGRPIESSALRIVTTQRTNDEYGPDLAFIALPPSPLLSELKARRSFFRLTTNVEQKLSYALQDTGFVPFCGYPASHQFARKAALGYSTVVELRGFAFITGPDKYEERNGWDYYELGVLREELSDFGDTFGGVSGGGIWRIPVYRKAGQPKGSEYFDRMTFAGVAFYEENHLPDGRFFVRAHGPKAVYERFLPLIREQLGRCPS